MTRGMSMVATEQTAGLGACCRVAVRRKGQRGAQILEAALVLPILFFVIFGIIWMGLAFNISSTIHRAARDAVRAGASSTCALCGNVPPTNAQVVTYVNDALEAAHLQLTQIVPYSPPFACSTAPPPSCSTVSNVQICRDVPLNCGELACQSPPAACGVSAQLGMRVSFSYQFNAPVPIGGFRSITLNASAESPGEN